MLDTQQADRMVRIIHYGQSPIAADCHLLNRRPNRPGSGCCHWLGSHFRRDRCGQVSAAGQQPQSISFRKHAHKFFVFADQDTAQFGIAEEVKDFADRGGRLDADRLVEFDVLNTFRIQVEMKTHDIIQMRQLKRWETSGSQKLYACVGKATNRPNSRQGNKSE